MANSNESKAMNDMEALAPEFAKLTKEFLFGDIWERLSKDEAWGI